MVLAVSGLFKEGGTAVATSFTEHRLGHLEHEIGVGLRRLVGQSRVGALALVAHPLITVIGGGARSGAWGASGVVLRGCLRWWSGAGGLGASTH